MLWTSHRLLFQTTNVMSFLDDINRWGTSWWAAVCSTHTWGWYRGPARGGSSAGHCLTDPESTGEPMSSNDMGPPCSPGYYQAIPSPGKLSDRELQERVWTCEMQKMQDQSMQKTESNFQWSSSVPSSLQPVIFKVKIHLLSWKWIITHTICGMWLR